MYDAMTMDDRGDGSRHRHLRTATSTAVALLLFAVCSFGTRVVARYFYDRFWPGHPDDFRAETALLPQLSFYSFGNHFWHDGEQALIFVTAGCVFVLPPIAALAATRGRFAPYLVALATLAIAAFALWDIWQRYDSYLRIFLPQEHSVPQVIRWARKDAAWVTGLSAAGLLAGGGIRMFLGRRRYLPGCCRSCGYDLRVQSALGIPRCPECGALLHQQQNSPT